MNEEYRILYAYLDDLLRLQSSAADTYEHFGVLGTVRENFIIQQLKDRIDNLNIHGGQVIGNGLNAGQKDVIVRKMGTLNPDHGGQVRIIASDCAAVLEVKSNAVGTDFRDFNKKARIIKSENPKVKCGFICYKLGAKKRNILKKFGVSYDMDLLNFEISSQLPIDLGFIDFALCLDDSEEIIMRNGKEYTYNKFFFIQKNKISNQHNLILKPPFSFYFLSEIQSAFNCA